MRIRCFNTAFTLIELLVSMVVLLLLVTGVVVLVNGVSNTTTAERRHLASDNEARRVFDRMATDIARMVKRADTDTVFASIKGAPPSGANDKMFFYSEAPAYFDTTAMAAPTPTQSTAGLIGYRIHDEAVGGAVPNLQLERLGKGLTWDMASTATTPGGVVFLTYPPAVTPAPAPSPNPLPLSTFVGVSTVPGSWTDPNPGAYTATIGTSPNFDDGVDVDFHVLSPDVFRLEFCFILKNPVNGNLYTTTLAQGQGFSNVSAIIVGLALLDAQGRALLPSNVLMTTLAAALSDPDFTISPPKLMAETWSAVLDANGAAAKLKVPQPVVSQIRVYQRTFYLNTP